MPIVLWRPLSIATLSLVPTPSVAATSTGSRYPARLRSNNPPNPPISAAAPGRAVARTKGLIRSTVRLPASISTPACAYVRPRFCSPMMDPLPRCGRTCASPNGPAAVILYRYRCDLARFRQLPPDGASSRDCLEYSKSHNARPYLAGADRSLGDRLWCAVYVDRFRPLPRRWRE